MIKNYFKVAWRNLKKNKTHSFINIFGLSVGMAVAMLISLWVYDELSFNKNFDNYKNIAKVWQFVKFTDETSAYDVSPIPLAEELRAKYPEFKSVSLAANHVFSIAYGDKKFSKSGNYAEPVFTEMMSLQMLKGTRSGLNDINSIMLSSSLSKTIFGDEDPVNKLIKLDNKYDVKVTGVYSDFPVSSSFNDVLFLVPWKLYLNEKWVKDSEHVWDNNSFQVYVQLNKGADFDKVSAKIKDIRMKLENPPAYKPAFFLHPMSKWHLYSDFKNGLNVGGAIQFVWLFGIVGIFVLILACINFMNLSTARSEKRAKEVGIRKAIGSARKQLIAQFFSESLLVTFISFLLALILSALILPFFNGVADKNMALLWWSPLFWIAGIVFSLVTGIIAGSYPALYLSSFQPVKVLKGTFRVGRFAAIPRKVLVVVQFTVSVVLIIGTIIVFRQIQHAKDRPVNYASAGLIEMKMNTPDLYGHYDALRNELLNSGAVEEFSESSASMTEQPGGTTNIKWRGKNPENLPLLISNQVTHDYGKTIGWKLSQGRDFSRTFTSDSSAMILNESAVKLMGFKDPLGEIVTSGGKDYQVVGVVKDMIKQSPFVPVSPSFFTINYKSVSMVDVKLSSAMGTTEALDKVEGIFKKYNPSGAFEYNFVDEEYGKKFKAVERIGKLAGFFAVLAILISCLGLFGMASFVAEQRTKEIGVRKVLGASILNVWGLLSKEFVVLVFISFLIAAPVAYYYMHGWLQGYEYRTELSWWIFAVAGMGALAITLITVSFQAIKAAVANPVKSLRSE
jgi:putative ABC transport system permease protein